MPPKKKRLQISEFLNVPDKAWVMTSDRLDELALA